MKISSKLGYSFDEVRKCLRDENSFVSILYHKLQEEQQKSCQSSRYSSMISAKSGVEPSVIPSVSGNVLSMTSHHPLSLMQSSTNSFLAAHNNN